MPNVFDNIYLPTFLTQKNNTDPYHTVNCCAYSFAMLTDANTYGGCRITGAQVRALTNEPKPDPDSPGLNISQVMAVSHKLHLTIGSNLHGTHEVLFNSLALGRQFIVPGVAAAIPLALRDGDPNFVKSHMIFVGHLVPGKSAVLVGNPLDLKFREWPIAVLFAYWDAYAKIVGNHPYAYSQLT
jgi:hypothetical protein